MVRSHGPAKRRAGDDSSRIPDSLGVSPGRVQWQQAQFAEGGGTFSTLAGCRKNLQNRFASATSWATTY
jgi:hypothetical protein